MPIFGLVVTTRCWSGRCSRAGMRSDQNWTASRAARMSGRIALVRRVAMVSISRSDNPWRAVLTSRPPWMLAIRASGNIRLGIALAGVEVGCRIVTRPAVEVVAVAAAEQVVPIAAVERVLRIAGEQHVRSAAAGQ